MYLTHFLKSFVFILLIQAIGFSSTGDFFKNLQVPLGIRFEHNFEELMGLEIGVSSLDLVNYRPEIRLAYTTTWIQTGILDKHVLLENRLLTELAWNFRPLRIVNPFAELGYEFIWTDYEGFDLDKPNPESHIRLGVGLGIRLLAGQTGINAKFGLAPGENPDWKYWGVSLWYNIGKWLGGL